MALLRSFKQAVYSPQSEGHFALASEHYCHFTSPIRRYPDLTIHRLLDRLFAGELTGKAGKRARAEMDLDDIKALGRHCSFTERRAADAERELNELKVLELLSEHIGDHLYGVVTGVANIGVFVQCSRYMIDGLIRFNDLSDDWWELNPQAGAVVGQRSGRTIQIGDLLEVQVVDVDLPRRELDLRLIADFGRKADMNELMGDVPTSQPESDLGIRRAQERESARQRSQRKGGPGPGGKGKGKGKGQSGKGGKGKSKGKGQSKGKPEGKGRSGKGKSGKGKGKSGGRKKN
jgi:ribonuclease R